MEDLNITTEFEELENLSKYKIKKIVENKIWQKQEFETQKSHKCKKLNINTHHQKNYLTNIEPKDTKTILLSRIRMIDIKTNFKNKYKNTTCLFYAKKI